MLQPVSVMGVVIYLGLVGAGLVAAFVFSTLLRGIKLI
ncbi:cytochrome b6/f complex subunit VI [Synechococcus sp. SYN20]|nr:cytochrome B6 [Synechococcus sp. MVIR-18-1]QNI77670.1 cytochrome b6/f complex subunit VI [Synechococcus sp. MVIR-18-1]QNJ27350.1 cytochrome b6/f complex subunit VI [Synechococcus sp. SYN20]